MTGASAAGLLSREFAHRVDAAHFQRFLQRQLDEQKRRDRKEDIEQGSDGLDMAVAVITTVEAAQFKMELDTYDVAVVNALNENDRKMEIAQAEWDRILAKAHVLPDGRRVFKNDDGTKVFDEFEQEVPLEVIHPDEIDDSRPRWKVAQKAIGTIKSIAQERTEVLEYQAKLDEARERVNSGEMTREELDRYHEELKAEIPDAVRQQIPELADDPKAAVAASAAKAAELDFSGDVAPSRPTANGFAPG